LGIRSDILRRQSKNRRAAVRELDPAALKALGVRWLMFSNEELKNLGPQARAELSNPDSKRFEMMAEFKAGSDSRTRKIWRLVEPE